MPGQSYTKEIHEFWNTVKASFIPKLSETAVDLWFGELEILSFQDASEENNNSEFSLTMGIPSEFKFKIIQDKYLKEIEHENIDE